MKNIKMVLMLLIGVIYLSSCDKNDSLNQGESNSEDLSIFDFLPEIGISQSQGTVALSAYGVGNSTVVNFNASASVFSTNARTTKVDAGAIQVNSVSLTKDSNHEYINLSDQSSAYGQNTIFSIAGNSGSGISAASATMYVPELIDLTLSNSEQFSKSQNLTFTWNSDANNSDVYVRLSYSRGLNEMINSSATWSNIVLNYTTNDDGAFTINSSDLSSLPLDGIVDVTVARGNYTFAGSAQKHLVFAGSLDSKLVKITN